MAIFKEKNKNDFYYFNGLHGNDDSMACYGRFFKN
jgi:hypothetical protein